MIAKAIKGRGFRGALEYDLAKDKAHVIDTNMGGSTPRALAKEFGEIRKLRPKLGKAVLYVSLSAAPGEDISEAQWQQISQRYLRGMGLENNQYLVTRHTDTEHPHIHLLVNRIRFDGGVTSDSHDYRRHEVLMRVIERDFKLRQVRPSIEAKRHAPTKGEIEEGLRTGLPSTRQRLQQLCDSAAERCYSFTDYAERLQAAGIRLVPVTQLGGTKLSGLSYLLDGVMMKGSDLGKAYSPMGLAKRGVGYVKNRDHEAVGRCFERGAGTGAASADRVAARGEAEQRGRIGVPAGAVGKGDGSIDPGDLIKRQEDRTDRAAQPRSKYAVQNTNGGGAYVVEAGRIGSRGCSVQNGQTRRELRRADRFDGGVDRIVHRIALDRILALARTVSRNTKNSLELLSERKVNNVTSMREIYLQNNNLCISNNFKKFFDISLGKTSIKRKYKSRMT
nr:relaxase/mobilization nuclease domain-containing protein [Duganella sp. CF517]